MGIFDWLGSLFGKAPSAGGELDIPLDQGMDVIQLALRLGRPAGLLRAFQPAYSEFTIPKRSGGSRRILAPTPETKDIQRCLLRRLLGKLRAHPAANGFEKGRSIVTNAVEHVGKAVVLRMDIRDFFPSTSAARVTVFFRRIGWNGEAAEILTRLTTHDGGLPQGAPTSPRLSNLVNFPLDARLAGLADAMSHRLPMNPRTGVSRAGGGVGQPLVSYTRYADDITFSFSEDSHNAVSGTIRATKRIAEDFGYRLHTKKKLRIARRGDRQMVTGLVVNDVVNLPRRTRRMLRAVEHHHATGREATLTPEQFAGWCALEEMVLRQSRPG